MSKQIGVYPDGYRNAAFSGFIAPGFCVQQHFHVAIEPTKYKAKLHKDSLEAIFGLPKPNFFGANLKFDKKSECHPPAEPAPSTSSAAKRDLEASFADCMKSPFQNSSFRSPMPSKKLDLSARPPSHARHGKPPRLMSSTPRKLFPSRNESFSSLGISELSFADNQMFDSGFLSDTLAIMESDFTRLQEQQTRLDDRVKTLEQEVAALRNDMKTISGLVGELASAIRSIIKIFNAK